MRFEAITQLDVGAAQPYDPYAPEPIEHEVTEVIRRADPIIDDDFEPEPLPPIPARGSRSYTAVTIYPRYR